MTLSLHDLVGAWELISVVEVFADGDRRPELGDNASGYLCYSPDGIVSAVLGNMERGTSSAGDPQTTPDADLAAMARQFIAYAGPYTVEGDTVVHHVDVALFSNWQGGDQIRRVRLDANQLIIQASPRTGADGRSFHSELRWGRYRSSAASSLILEGTAS